jgi:uncharacterized membrane protein YeaQ/YmgE (transglycosylase-associated protein family)
MDFEALALALMLVLWAALGTACWLAGAVARRGRGILPALPLAALGGLAGGLLVPALGRRDGVGLLVSLLAAVVGGLVFTAAGFRLSR